MILVEGLCYLYPHQPEIVADHPAMKGVWRTCLQLLNNHDDSFLAPLLIDDLRRVEDAKLQRLHSLLKRTIGRTYESLPWFGKPVMESSIAIQYGNLGCKLFDAIYHKEILLALAVCCQDWRWIVVHPATFQGQQSGMLEQLWKMVHGGLDFSLIAQRMCMGKEELIRKSKTEFFGRFIHHWIGDDGVLSRVTVPVWHNKKVHHTSVT